LMGHVEFPPPMIFPISIDAVLEPGPAFLGLGNCTGAVWKRI